VRWRLVIIVLVVLAIVATPFAWEHKHGIATRFRHYVLGIHTPPPGILDVGARFPAFPFATLDGSKAEVLPRPGRILYVVVFTTWCPDCVNETPALEQLRQATASKPVDIIGLDQQEDPATINSFIQRFGLTFPILIDQENVTAESFGVHYIPVAYIIDSKGVVRGHVIGPQTLPEMMRLIEDALHGRPVGLGS